MDKDGNKRQTVKGQKVNNITASAWISWHILPLAALGVLITAYLWSRSSGATSAVTATCLATPPNSQVKILSLDPFIAHITDFVSESERKYLIDIGKPLLSSSTTLDDSGNQASSSYRTSSSAFLPPTDPCVSRIVHRAADFQGYLSPSDINIQLTAYQPGQQYKHHYDWFSAPANSPTTPLPRNTISTFFAILHATCHACGTEFPFLNTTNRHRYDERWCYVIDCDKPVLTTRNVEGSALFWINLDAQGRGREDTLHSGLPANGGEKIGLNVWTDFEVNEVWDRGLFGGSLKPPA
ncbi:hypothetical protein BKA66DRAFT_443347 [Pyrenochaeta sp. MPI-SDFR-AT-0127]|nr:hypothetical protein BKA66DRAFT_443347 [Pyrenochaeta sp. MPI-SDFR-AT-0127]